jgi:hypothetical protein
MLNVGDALQGNTLPSGTSAALGNLLTENSSSVLKEGKKNVAKNLTRIYKETWIPYLLEVFDSQEDIKKYLYPNDIKLVERAVTGYLMSLDQINAEIEGREYDPVASSLEAKNQLKKALITPDLLKALREDVAGIEPIISGEQLSKPKIVAFLRQVRLDYAANPALFKDPFYVETLKKEAQFDAGMSQLEVEQLLKEII